MGQGQTHTTHHASLAQHLTAWVGYATIACLAAGCLCNPPRPPRTDYEAPPPGLEAEGDHMESHYSVHLRQHITGAGTCTVQAVAPLPSGDFIIAGTFSGRLDLGTAVLAQGTRDAFVARLSAQGELQWLRHLYATDTVQLNAIAVAGDDLWLAGHFEGELHLGDLRSATAQGAFVALLDLSGAPAWLNSHGPAGSASAAAIVAAGDHAWLTGFVSQNGLTQSLTQAWHRDGTLRWSHTSQGSTFAKSAAIARTPSGVLVGGDFSDDLAMGEHRVSSSGGRDIFLTALDDAGQPQWLRAYGGPATDRATALAVAPDGRLFLGGVFTTSLTMDTATIEGGHLRNPFIAALSPTGEHLWSRAFVSSQPGEVRWLGLLAGMGDATLLAVAGHFQGEVNLGGGLMVSNDLSADLFVGFFACDDGNHQRSFWLGCSGQERLHGAAMLGNSLEGVRILLGASVDTCAEEPAIDQDGLLWVVSP